MWPSDPVKEARALSTSDFSPPAYIPPTPTSRPSATPRTNRLPGHPGHGQETFTTTLSRSTRCTSARVAVDTYSVLDLTPSFLPGAPGASCHERAEAYTALKDAMMKRPAVQRVARRGRKALSNGCRILFQVGKGDRGSACLFRGRFEIRQNLRQPPIRPRASGSRSRSS